MSQNYSHITDRLRDLGITREKLAELINCSPSAFSHWMSGRSPMSPRMLERINAALDVMEEAERAADAAREVVLEKYRLADQAAVEARQRVIAEWEA